MSKKQFDSVGFEQQGRTTLTKEELRELTEPPECPMCSKPFFSGSCGGCGYIDPNRDNEHIDGC